MTEISGHCEQSATFSCLRTAFSDNVIVRDRDGFQMNSMSAYYSQHIRKSLFINSCIYSLDWGGAPTNSSKCACGTRGACTGSQFTDYDCACDVPGSTATSDSGRLIDKNVLPVSQICMGLANDTSQARSVGYSLGHLICRDRHFGL